MLGFLEEKQIQVREDIKKAKPEYKLFLEGKLSAYLECETYVKNIYEFIKTKVFK